MSKYRYEMGGIIRDTEIDFPYYTDEIIGLLDEKDRRIAELEEQLASSIRPKFKRGQTCYYIFNGIVGIFKPEKVCEVRDLLISGIQFYGQEIQYQTTYGLFNENDLFASEEEALKKLEELKG